MGDWNFLGGILEEVHIHSTMVGKIWLTILFIFRMLVLGVAAEDVWNDEQKDFICNTEQPGCRNVCYDLAFPISLIRYWVLQVIFVSSPSLVYMGHALYRLRELEKGRQKKKAQLKRELELVDVELMETRKRIEREMKQVDQSRLNKAPLRGSLLRTYVTHVVTRSVMEVLFMTGQYLLYGFHLHPLFKCERSPCPNLVDCYVSRPTEKSVFMVFMQVIAAISLSLNILEIMHLGYKKIKRVILDFYPRFRDGSDEFEDRKESVIQMYSARKATIPSSDYNLLQGSYIYPNLIQTSSFQPRQQEDCAQCGGHRSESSPTAHEPCSSGCSDVGTLKQQEADHMHSVKNGSDSTSPENVKLSVKTLHSSSVPPSVRKPLRAHSCFQFSTVFEGRSSDTDSYSGAKNNRRVQLQLTPQTAVLQLQSLCHKLLQQQTSAGPADLRTVHTRPADLRTIHTRPADLRTIHTRPADLRTIHTRPADLRTIHTRPADLRTIHTRPADLRTIHTRPADLRTIHTRPADLRTIHTRPADLRTIHTRPADLRTIYTSPADLRTIHTRPADLRTIYTRPADLRTIHTRPADLRTIYTRPADLRTIHTRPADLRTIYTRPADLKTVHTRPADLRTVHTRPADLRTIHTRPADLRTVHTRPADLRTIHTRPADLRTIYTRPADLRTIHTRPADLRTIYTRPADLKTVHTRPADLRTVHTRPADLRTVHIILCQNF
uniref:Gap junction protein n=1 Tax=Knipowitschia caucasica TaxID=637954 RepID=A0AAV2MAB3_KNICA